MSYHSTNIINISEIKKYEPYRKLDNCQEPATCRFGEQDYQVKQIFEKDSNIMLFALRCLLGAILIVPAICFGFLFNKKFEWVANLFVRKNLYIVIDKNEKIAVNHISEPLSSQAPSPALTAVDPKKPVSVDPRLARVKPADYFVQALNAGEYSLNGLVVKIPAASMPIHVSRNHAIPLENEINDLKKNHHLIESPLKVAYVDKSTEEAINVRNGMAKLALNFANEHHAGGGPGFHKDPKSGLFVYDCPSARAQEESMCQRSTLMASLTQLPHILVEDGGGSKMNRSYYTDSHGSDKKVAFDSRKAAYMSDNHLFAVQNNNQFYESAYLEEPQAVTFITSAATCYGHYATIDSSVGSAVYVDAKQRIETHLYAAAVKAVKIKQDTPNKPVELILGAFGCGAFAPQDFNSGNDYRSMIATIYKELLPKFNGIFDQVTFAVPTFGQKEDVKHPERTQPAVLNYILFKKVMLPNG